MLQIEANELVQLVGEKEIELRLKNQELQNMIMQHVMLRNGIEEILGDVEAESDPLAIRDQIDLLLNPPEEFQLEEGGNVNGQAAQEAGQSNSVESQRPET